jgi:nucleoside phosphorylase
MAPKVTKIADIKGKVDFGIITIRQDEYEAVLQRLPTESIATGRQTYALSRVMTSNDDEYLIASVRCPEQGNGQGQATAHILIEELRPQWILLVGIAGSVPDYEYTLGDVLLATRLHDFSVSASIEDSGQQTRKYDLRGGPMHPKIQSLLGSLPAIEPFFDRWNTKQFLTVNRPTTKVTAESLYGDTKWKAKVQESLNRYFGKKPVRRIPKAFTGSIASSDTLVKDTQLIRQWQDSTRHINGIEMELAGVYHAAWEPNTPVLAIRGISDVVGFNRSPDWTSYACHSAASFMLALLKYRPFPPRSVSEFTEEEVTPARQNEQVGVFKNPPFTSAPLVKQEQLFSNLINIEYFPEKLYSVATGCEDAKAVWAILNSEVEEPPTDWIYRGKMLYAFHDFSNSIWKKVCGNNIAESQPTSHWSSSEEQDRINEFIELLKNCLKEFGKGLDLKYIHKQRVKGIPKKFQFIYYAPTTEYTVSPSFRGEDFIDADKLVLSLRDKTTPLAEHLLSILPEKTQALIEQYPESANQSLRDALVDGFNELLKTNFYDPRLFEEVRVRWEAKRLLEADSLDERTLIRLNRILLEDAYWHEISKRVLTPRRIVMKSLVRSMPTEVFRATLNKGGRISYYRHHAFRPHFIRLDGKWYMEITPTYHYTWNGYSVSSMYEDLIKKIKQIERNEAVFRQVMFWSKVLQDNKSEFLERQVYPYLRFGQLLEYRLDYGIRDELWLNREIPEDNSTERPRRRGGRSRERDNSQSSLAYES